MRTSSGLLSLHRFLNVDIVVYCEGKCSKAEDDDEGDDVVYENTTDVYYWSKVAAALGLVKRYHFKSLGSKTSLQKMANDVAASGIATITVCVDADYDSLIGPAFDTDRTCRTYGYSWENDVLSEEIFLEVIEDVIGIGPAQTSALDQIRTTLRDLRPILAKWTEIDISLKKLGKGCVFDRRKPTSCLDFQRHPELREAVLQQRLRDLGYSRGPRRVVTVTDDDASRRCFGKLWAKNLYHYGMQILSGFDIQRPSYELFMRQAIAATFRRAHTIYGGAFLAFHRAQAGAFA